MVDEQQEDFWQEDMEVLPELTEDIPDYKFIQGKNYNTKLIK